MTPGSTELRNGAFRRWAVGVLLVIGVMVLVGCAGQSDSAVSNLWNTIQRAFVTQEGEEGRGTSPLWLFVFATIVITAIGTVAQAIRRDRILRRHNGKYVVLLHGDSRYTGIVRLILHDIEIASEKTDVQGKDSGRLFTENEFRQMKAMLRYHDEMTERELEERRVFAEKIVNPTLLGRILRRLQSLARQFNETVKTIYEEAVGKPLRQRLQRFRGERQLEELTAAQIEEVTGVSPTGGASYRLLIDRLIGTRVIARILDRDYECILADYTKEFYHLLDVEFVENWSVNVYDRMGQWVGNDKGFRFRLEDGEFVIESRVPYPVVLRHVRYRNGKNVAGAKVGDQDRNNVNLRIEPFETVRWKPQYHHEWEERDVAGGLLQEVRYPIRLRPDYWGQILFEFETRRKADLVIRYADNVIQYRAEKTEAHLVTLDSLTEVIWRTSSRFVLTDEDGNAIRSFHINRGYITNLSKDRLDIHEVMNHYSRRWESERDLERLDARLRPIRRRYRWYRVPLLGKGRVAAAQIAAILFLQKERHALRPDQRMLYFPFVRPRKELIEPPPTRRVPLRVGVLAGRPFDEEFEQLRKFERIHDHRMVYHKLNAQRPERLEKMDILWVGYGANLHGAHRLSRAAEVAITQFAAEGGVVIAWAPNTIPPRGNRLGWIPDPLVRGKGTLRSQAVEVTREGGPLFHEPHEIDLEHLVPQVWWSDWSDRYVPLLMVEERAPNETDRIATVGVRLEYGSGLFLVFGIGPQTPEDFSWSVPLAENLLHAAVRWKEEQNPALSRVEVA